ncbi:MAG TPA: methylenetetrahydrofolate reductase [Vicinamibacterales bacterium]
MRTLIEALRSDSSVFAAELRPPRAELASGEGIDAWIDTYHAVRRLTRDETFVCLTDSAVGADEEDNLRHLMINVGADAPLPRIVPFLTCKHPLPFCLGYADRARQHGFRSLVVLGGDRHIGTPRCVEHAWQLRKLIREREPDLVLGGWANPAGDAERQVAYLADSTFYADFFLTQIVSHHHLAPIDRFLDERARRGVDVPGLFGVFFYRSANPRTLEALANFLPVPQEALAREFAEGATAEDVCARTIRALRDRGVRHVYISNLPNGSAHRTLAAIRDRVEGQVPQP